MISKTSFLLYRLTPKNKIAYLEEWFFFTMLRS
jgi:hypothetical protein